MYDERGVARGGGEVGIARAGRADEFFGEDHGRVGEVGGVVAHEEAEGEFAVADHGRGDVEGLREGFGVCEEAEGAARGG